MCRRNKKGDQDEISVSKSPCRIYRWSARRCLQVHHSARHSKIGQQPDRGGYYFSTAGLQRAATPPAETVRAIRAIEVGDPAEGQKRRFSGVAQAADTSSISFEVPGNVLTVNVEVGENITKGQVLAVLDDRTFRMNVAATQAVAGRAEVKRNHARNEVENADGERVAFSAGDFVTFPKDLDCAWNVKKAVRKHYRFIPS
jgi:uncharacterized cupin superfamily protein